jgi:hypothetical protein
MQAVYNFFVSLHLLLFTLTAMSLIASALRPRNASGMNPLERRIALLVMAVLAASTGFAVFADSAGFPELAIVILAAPSVIGFSVASVVIVRAIAAAQARSRRALPTEPA